MTSATPKPRAGEHPDLDALMRSWGDHASAARKFGDALTFARSMEAERDLLRERERELVEALERIAAGMGNLPLDQMGEAGVHGINDGKQRAIYLEDYVRTARSLLSKHGR